MIVAWCLMQESSFALGIYVGASHFHFLTQLPYRQCVDSRRFVHVEQGAERLHTVATRPCVRNSYYSQRGHSHPSLFGQSLS